MWQFGVTQGLHWAFVPEWGERRHGDPSKPWQGCKGQRRKGEGIGPRMAKSPCSSGQQWCLFVPPPRWFEAIGRHVVLGIALTSSGPAAEAALSSATQADPPASAPTSKPVTSSPPRDSLTPGPGPSSAALLRQLPAKAPATDTISECPGIAGAGGGGWVLRSAADGAVGLG